MNPFKILQVKKMIKEGREDPSKFAGGQVGEILWGLVIVPIIVGVVALGLFFIMGYTHLFGFQAGVFKFLFWIGLLPAIVVFLAVHKMIGGAGQGVSSGANKIIEAVARESSDGQKEV